MIRALLITAGLAFWSGSLQAEEFPNPLYTNWAKFKPGTSVTQKSSVDAPGFKTETELTYELIKVTEKDVTLKYTANMTFNGQMVATPPQEMVYTKMVTRHEAVAESKEEQPVQEYKSETDPDETLTIDGQKFVCRVSRSTNKMGDINASTKVWQSDDVPGQTLKLESSVDQGAAGKTVTTLVTTKVVIK
ncbi:hypothetical protein [Lacunimicrobium album]